ncbi:hypothetical protein [Rhizobium sp. N324]|uniref:hypothetical protein n=1 Tax=Rhizobium sp. N324 TaxID=1703969 RepID=UPI003FA7984C
MTNVLVAGDRLVFDVQFGSALLSPTTTTVKGSAMTSSSQGALCYESDLLGLPPVNATYVIPGATPGTGLVSVTALAEDQVSVIYKDGGKPVVLARGKFEARLQVVTPAVTATGAPDPTPRYDGAGSFLYEGSRPDVE